MASLYDKILVHNHCNFMPPNTRVLISALQKKTLPFSLNMVRKWKGNYYNDHTWPSTFEGYTSTLLHICEVPGNDVNS